MNDEWMKTGGMVYFNFEVQNVNWKFKKDIQ